MFTRQMALLFNTIYLNRAYCDCNTTNVKNMHLDRDSNPGPWNTQDKTVTYIRKFFLQGIYRTLTFYPISRGDCRFNLAFPVHSKDNCYNLVGLH